MPNILMPALSPTMEEGKLAKWLVKEGDTVNPGDVLAEIETDKATMEVESVDSGRVDKLLVPEGTEGVVRHPKCVFDRFSLGYEFGLNGTRDHESALWSRRECQNEFAI